MCATAEQEGVVYTCWHRHLQTTLLIDGRDDPACTLCLSFDRLTNWPARSIISTYVVRLLSVPNAKVQVLRENHCVERRLGLHMVVRFSWYKYISWRRITVVKPKVWENRAMLKRVVKMFGMLKTSQDHTSATFANSSWCF